MHSEFGGGFGVKCRTIIHADLNNCYASVEMLHHPKLREHPMVVGGSVENRHGIVLSGNYLAKSFGVKVAQPLWEARQKCPGLIVVPPNYDRYLRFSRHFRKILSDYSPKVEPFGLDEAWADVSGCYKHGGDGHAIADEIRERVKFELGVTASVGVSYNKIFSKLGSDMKKPDATTIITEENFRETVWPLPASDLLGVGRATKAKLAKYGIHRIGDIASCDVDFLQKWLGKWGLYLYSYANGWDKSPVADIDEKNIIKSIGNSTTCPRDLENDEDAKIVFQNLAESVAERMREQGLMAKTVQISLRTNDLFWFERQIKLPLPTHVSTELCAAAMSLLRENWKWDKPLRSVGIRGANLVPMSEPRQISIFYDEKRRQKAEAIEHTIDTIRRSYGHYAIDRALLLLDEKLGKLNPKKDHTIHPVGYMKAGVS